MLFLVRGQGSSPPLPEPAAAPAGAAAAAFSAADGCLPEASAPELAPPLGFFPGGLLLSFESLASRLPPPPSVFDAASAKA